MVDVFISYSRKDEAAVARLARAVMAEGYDVWWDADLPPHKSYGDVITAKIAEANAAIVVWSADAVQSEWVRAEADMARNQRKLIQTALGGAVPPLPFNQIQYAQIGDWQGEPDHPGWRKVKASLADLCGPAGEPRAAPPPSVAAPAAAPSPPAAPVPASRTRWPLFAGIAAAVVVLAVAGGLVLNQRARAPAPSTPVAAVAAGQQQQNLAVQPLPAQPTPAPAPEPPALAGDGGDPAPAPGAPAELGVPPGPAPEPNPSDMTFADSSTRLLTAAEVSSLGPTTLRVARNEILARKGRRFADPWLRDWFARYAWYRPRLEAVELNDIERQNIALIRQAEARYQ